MTRQNRQSTQHGYVVIDKPAGWTSHDVVARVRRIVDEKRVGHAGTLDPAATGVLPVAVGQATRTVEYLADSSKSYRAWIQFGVTTDSADGDGAIVATSDPSELSLAMIDQVLPRFRGHIAQRPPMHSAIKVGGKRLYEFARLGVEIDVADREVTIYDLQVVEWLAPELCIDVDCAKGTYIRALARDIGDAVETGAHLARLVRTRTGPFTLADAMSLEDLERALEHRGWEQIAFPPDKVLEDRTAVVLGSSQSIDWGHGKSIVLEVAEGITAIVRTYDAHGRWLGVGSMDVSTSTLRPVKVIAAE
jgi:tRNA pseudouridine55 synthase